MKEFWHEQFDKMLLLILIMVFLAVTISGKGPEQFSVRVVDNLTGALVAIITGNVFAGRNKPPLNPPQPPPEA